MKTNEKPNTDRLTSLGKGTQMNPQKIARVTGVLFVITYIASIPPVLFLYGPLLDDPRYILGGGAADNGLALGALLELILIIANIGTAVVLYPVVKRVNEILALGFVTARVVESAFIAVGVLSVLSMVTLRQEAAGADAGSLLAVGQSLVALHHWTFLLGPGFVVGIGNGLILGYLMYRSGLVPRRMAVLGLSPALCSSPVSSAYCSGSSSRCPCWGASWSSRSSFGSCRSASGSSSRDSTHPQWLPCPPPR
jgi:hypothetical protein